MIRTKLPGLNNRFHYEYNSAIGNVLFPVTLKQIVLYKVWFTGSFKDSRIFQMSATRLFVVILCAWVCIKQRLAYGFGEFLVSFLS